MVKFKIVLLIFGILLAGCMPPIIHNSNFFSIRNQVYKNEVLRKDGYYCRFDKGKNNSGSIPSIAYLRILLDNQYTYSQIHSRNGNNDAALITETENILNNYQNSSKTRKNGVWTIWNWGRYKEEENRILIQTFYNRFGDYCLIEEEGQIIDSLSFIILRKMDFRTKEEKYVEEKYIFTEFDVRNLYDKIPKEKLSKWQYF